MRKIKVAAAVIRQGDQILATQRGYGEFKGGWEFPGGKLENGETPQKALMREMKEELDAEIKVGKFIHTVEYDYPNFHLSMDCFWATLSSPNYVLKEHQSAKWLSAKDINTVNWLPADKIIVEKVQKELQNTK